MKELALLSMLMGAGFSKPDAATMVCIAKLESGLDPKAINSGLNKDGSADYGLFQINDLWLDHCKVSKKDLLDPQKNIACAKKVFDIQGFKAWVTYKKYGQEVCNNYIVFFDWKLKRN